MISPRVRKRDGRRVYDVRLRDPSGKVYMRTFDTKREAEAFEADEKSTRHRGAWVDPRLAELTFAELAQRWLAANPAKRATTRSTDESIVRAHLVPAFGPRPIGSVTPPDVQGVVNAWAKTQAPRTVKREYGVLRAIFAFAVNADWVARSPCRGIKLPSPITTRRTKLDVDQVGALADAMDERYQVMVWLGALGLRWEEVAGLRVGMIDVLRGTITVAETQTRDATGRPVYGPPKSAAGVRTFAIPKTIVDMLSHHLARRGLTAANADRLVFTSPEGEPLRYSNWRRRVWIPAAEASGLGELRFEQSRARSGARARQRERFQGAGFHDLRRFAGTVMVTEGVDVRTAQERLGHADPRVTLGIYAQAVDEFDRRAAARLDDALFGPRDGRAMDGKVTRVGGDPHLS